MSTNEFTRKVLTTVDSKDVEDYVAFFAPQGRLQLGNSPALVGREEIRAGVSAFYGTIGSISHDVVLNEWQVDDASTITELSMVKSRVVV